MTHIKSPALLVLAITLAWTTTALGLGRADNFVLLDNQGRAEELYYHRDAAAVVLIAQRNRCALDTDAVTRITATGPSVRVFMINSLDSRADIRTYASEHSLTVPVLHDSAQIIGQALHFDRAGEAVVVDPRNWQIVYQGALGDAGLSQAVSELASGSAVVAAGTANSGIPAAAGAGCGIEYTPLNAVPDYAADIAPILKKNCMACHIEGGIGPWAMTDYRMIQGFAPMIREVIRVKRMPPWHADPEVGYWQNSARLSDEDTRTLVSWIEAGAPRGEGDDPLLAERPIPATWPLGEPDLVLEIPSYDIPASGVVDYQFPVVANPLDHDVWVVAATIIPGNSKVVHHVLMGSAEKAPEKGDRESVFQNYIMGYAPGNESAHMPEGTGVFVPVGGVYQFQLHYTPTGIATTDSTRVALYFADEPPANFLRQQVVLNPALKIPPQVADHEEVAYFEF